MGAIPQAPRHADSPHPSIPSPEGEGREATRGARLPIEALAGGAGFRRDARFAPSAQMPPERPPAPVMPEAEDPSAAAWAEGYQAGSAEALAEADQRARADANARATLELGFARLDAGLQEELRLRLRDTVVALCEAAVAPLALDEAALLRRIETAVAMLARADDERLIRLHPDDLALVSPRLRAEWRVEPDPALERGAIRIESASGGVEDGPALWRRAIAEALHQC